MSASREALLGRVFGSLVVIEELEGTDRNRRRKVKVRCKCGRDEVTFSFRLTSDGKVECSRCATRGESLVGQKFGELTVVGDAPKREGHPERWVYVLCSCGNQKAVRLQSLRAGLTRSCGHLRPDQPVRSQRKPIAGLRFGKLVVISEGPSQWGWNATCCCDCGETVTVRRGQVTSGLTRACRKCSQEDRIEDRFWGKVDKNGPTMLGMATPCWIWTAAKDRDGYGTFWLDGENRMVRAIRVAYAFANELELLPDEVAGHRCNNPPCCNPEHLYATDPAGNNSDRTVQGRSACGDQHGANIHPESRPRGEDHHNSRFTPDQVREIRRLGAEGLSERKIAERFDCSRTAVTQILNRKTWGHLE